MSADLDLFRDLEESIWRSGTRSDPAYLDGVLNEQFTDFCRFGHVYDRDHLIDAPASDVEVEFPFEEFSVDMLAPTVALVTYVNTVVREGDRQRARRSSIWVDDGGGWQLRFVQATTLA